MEDVAGKHAPLGDRRLHKGASRAAASRWERRAEQLCTRAAELLERGGEGWPSSKARCHKMRQWSQANPRASEPTTGRAASVSITPQANLRTSQRRGEREQMDIYLYMSRIAL